MTLGNLATLLDLCERRAKAPRKVKSPPRPLRCVVWCWFFGYCVGCRLDFTFRFSRFGFRALCVLYLSLYSSTARSTDSAGRREADRTPCASSIGSECHETLCNRNSAVRRIKKLASLSMLVKAEATKNKHRNTKKRKDVC